MQVECLNCGARGPIYGDTKSAFLGWKKGEPVRCNELPNALSSADAVGGRLRRNVRASVFTSVLATSQYARHQTLW